MSQTHALLDSVRKTVTKHDMSDSLYHINQCTILDTQRKKYAAKLKREVPDLDDYGSLEFKIHDNRTVFEYLNI